MANGKGCVQFRNDSPWRCRYVSPMPGQVLVSGYFESLANDPVKNTPTQTGLRGEGSS